MITIWYLVLFTSIGMLSDKDSMALVSVPQATQQACTAAGNKAVSAFERGTKDVKYVCIEGVK